MPEPTQSDIEKAKEIVNRTLKGIDLEETADDDGWWETSVGADFGSGRKKAIVEAIAQSLAQSREEGRKEVRKAIEYYAIQFESGELSETHSEWRPVIMEMLRVARQAAGQDKAHRD